MRAIRSNGNRSTELRVKAILVRGAVCGWKVNEKSILGSPDFFFPKERVVVFVDGCFWHCCPKCGHIPRTNKVYWQAKISRNRARDARITRMLRKSGFHVVRLWECDLRQRPNVCLGRIRRAIQSGAAQIKHILVCPVRAACSHGLCLPVCGLIPRCPTSGQLWRQRRCSPRGRNPLSWRGSLREPLLK